MARYINTDVLEKSLDEQLRRIRLTVSNDEVKLISALLVYGIHLDIENTPAADLVEVVRCKDCQHWNTAECHSTAVPDARKCMAMNVFTDPDQFCKYGERISE